MSKGVARTKQKAMEKMGKAEGTIDLQMNQHKEAFGVTYEAMKKLSKDANDLMVIMKNLSVAQAQCAQDIHDLFQTQDQFYNTALKLQDSTRFVDNAREQFDTTLHEDMLEPISLYLGQYKEMKHRLEAYQTRRVDKDRYARDVRKAQEKGKYAELPHAEEKLRLAKQNYTALHDELMQDLPTMQKDKLEFIPLVVSTYVNAYTEYFRSAAKAMAETRAMTDSIDGNRVHGYAHCITPLDESAVKNMAGMEPGAHDSAEPEAAPAPKASKAPAAAAPVAAAAAPPPKPTPAPPKPTPSGPTATANFDFEAQEDNELPFKKGDVLSILTQDGDWWDAELNGAKGMVPANYLTLN